MNFKGDFKKIGELDISGLQQAVAAMPESVWLGSDWRQKKFETHKDTRTIQLIFDSDFRHDNPTYLPQYYELQEYIDPIVTLIASHYDNSLVARRLQKKHGKGYIVRMILVDLVPGGVVPPHGDQGYSLLHGHRIHVPIMSRGNALFTVGSSTMKLGEGEVWEINNRRTHSVTNESDSGRIHMITDWVIPGERCCCGKRLRPQGICSPEECRTTDHMETECSCYPH